MMKKSFKFIPFILLVAFSCNKQNRFQQIVIQDIPEAQTEIIRMDKEIYQLDLCITKPARKGNYDMLTVDIPKGDSACLSDKIDAIKERH